MINCNTQFGKLKEVIVGRELEISSRCVDITFKNFYKQQLGNGLYNSNYVGYTINSDILNTRIQQLDNLAIILQSFGIKVYRPEKISTIKKIKTPTFQTEHTSANNVRDITLIYKNAIIEMPVSIRNRIFENLNLFNIFNKKFDHGKNTLWIKSPITHLIEQTYDFEDWKNVRDFSNIPNKYEMAIDAPNFLIIGKDVLVNISTYSQYLGYEWIKSLFPETNFHIIHCADNHIDGKIINLKPGVFLLNPNDTDIINQLPEKFKKWKFLIPEKQNVVFNNNISDIKIQLATSAGIDINVLSIDEKNVLVNKRAKNVIKILEQNKFNVIPVELDYGELFAGGIHCSTLDLIREDEYIYYA